MTAPAQAIRWFGAALALGAGLGLFYGFLRPLRKKRTAPADLLFSAALFYAWLYLSFGVCRGDIRLGCTTGLFLGVYGFDRTVGRWLSPLFSTFWKGIGCVLRFLTYPVRKIFEKMQEIIKILFASLKKWGTIKWNKTRHAGKRPGGSHEEAEALSEIHQSGIPEKHRSDEDRRSGSRRIVYCGASDPADRH